MTRKDYRIIAKVLGRCNTDKIINSYKSYELFEIILAYMTDMLKEDNPRFNRDKFKAEVNKIAEEANL